MADEHIAKIRHKTNQDEDDASSHRGTAAADRNADARSPAHWLVSLLQSASMLTHAVQPGKQRASEWGIAGGIGYIASAHASSIQQFTTDFESSPGSRPVTLTAPASFLVVHGPTQGPRSPSRWTAAPAHRGPLHTPRDDEE